ncbi:hypothetical protein HHK36_014072 [Tetracentron sinense]|uniref:Transmembrane protein n=1 Tax=Tetracentron sinense TaxID=13715 RepID=A0A835DF35_TETSI|nr:hypothetical protein HHK36_014072 [Tetracentron sinense]
MRSGFAWVKLLHTCFWEFVIGFGGVLGFVGIPFCVGFANVMVVGHLARVLAVLESECSGFEAMIKAKNLIELGKETNCFSNSFVE